jgi:hypothetical protein
MGVASSETTSAAPIWIPAFGAYADAPNVGTAVNPHGVQIFLADFREDGTVTIDDGAWSYSIDEPSNLYTTSWTAEGGRVVLSGVNDGELALWEGVAEAWLEPNADEPGEIQFWNVTDGEIHGPQVLRPDCVCVPNPSLCCKEGCIDIELASCLGGPVRSRCAD